MVEVRGQAVDDRTRCVHYAGELDIVAIRFFCCDEWYPCLHCHADAAGHAVQRCPQGQHDAAAVLCGACRHQIRITEYLKQGACPSCEAPFNPGCSLHHHHYFMLEE